MKRLAIFVGRLRQLSIIAARQAEAESSKTWSMLSLSLKQEVDSILYGLNKEMFQNFFTNSVKLEDNLGELNLNLFN